MTIKTLVAAKHLAECSRWTLTNLAIQKLLYLANMVHLGVHEKSLVHGHFEAWEYGPVHPELYHELKMFGSSPVGNIFRLQESPPQDGTEVRILNEIQSAFADLSPSKLVAITHWSDGAWAKCYDPNKRHTVISEEDILEEYRCWTGCRNMAQKAFSA